MTTLRPTDWSPVYRETDPAPGNPDGIDSLRKYYFDTSTMLLEGADLIAPEQLGNNSSLTALSGIECLTGLREDMLSTAQRFCAANESLRRYSAELVGAQYRTAAALSTARDQQRRLERCLERYNELLDARERLIGGGPNPPSGYVYDDPRLSEENADHIAKVEQDIAENRAAQQRMSDNIMRQVAMCTEESTRLTQLAAQVADDFDYICSTTRVHGSLVDVIGRPMLQRYLAQDGVELAEDYMNDMFLAIPLLIGTACSGLGGALLAPMTLTQVIKTVKSQQNLLTYTTLSGVAIAAGAAPLKVTTKDGRTVTNRKIPTDYLDSMPAAMKARACIDSGDPTAYRHMLALPANVRRLTHERNPLRPFYKHTANAPLPTDLDKAFTHRVIDIPDIAEETFATRGVMPIVNGVGHENSRLLIEQAWLVRDDLTEGGLLAAAYTARTVATAMEYDKAPEWINKAAVALEKTGALLEWLDDPTWLDGWLMNHINSKRDMTPEYDIGDYTYVSPVTGEHGSLAVLFPGSLKLTWNPATLNIRGYEKKNPAFGGAQPGGSDDDDAPKKPCAKDCRCSECKASWKNFGKHMRKEQPAWPYEPKAAS